jgi:hypothetical protein
MEAATRVDAIKHALQASSAILSQRNADEWADNDPQITAANTALKVSFEYAEPHTRVSPDVMSLKLIKDPLRRLDRLALAIHLFSQPARTSFISLLYKALLAYRGREDAKLAHMSFTELVRYLNDCNMPMNVLSFMERVVDMLTAMHDDQGEEACERAIALFLDGAWEHATELINDLWASFKKQESTLRLEEAAMEQDEAAIGPFGRFMRAADAGGDSVVANIVRLLDGGKNAMEATEGQLSRDSAIRRIDAATVKASLSRLDIHDDWVIIIGDASFPLVAETIKHNMTVAELTLLFEDDRIKRKVAAQ